MRLALQRRLQAIAQLDAELDASLSSIDSLIGQALLLADETGRLQHASRGELSEDVIRRAVAHHLATNTRIRHRVIDLFRQALALSIDAGRSRAELLDCLSTPGEAEELHRLVEHLSRRASGLDPRTRARTVHDIEELRARAEALRRPA